MKKRQKINPFAEFTNDIPNTAGALNNIRKAWPKRGPTKSHRVPIATRAAIVPVTAAIPALAKSPLVKSRSSRMIGIRAAGPKVETNDVKKENHDA